MSHKMLRPFNVKVSVLGHFPLNVYIYAPYKYLMMKLRYVEAIMKLFYCLY